MPADRPAEVTALLARVRDGDPSASDLLLPLIYDELRGLAHVVFSDQRPGHTLQPTALVNEAWMKVAGGLDRIEDRKHFLAVAARAMRQVLVDYARGRNRQKRGGVNRGVTLDTNLAGGSADVDLVALDDALRRLAELNPRHAQVVELRLLGSLTIDETADMLDVSHTTVESDWAMAKVWLRTELAG